MEKESYNIEIVKRFKINQIGMPLAMLSVFVFVLIIFSTAANVEYSVKEFTIITIVVVLLVSLGLWLDSFRKFEKAHLNFHPEGVIMNTTQGYVPLKYDSIQKLSLSSINSNKSQFYIYAEDGRKFEVQTDTEIYDGLIEIFPDKAD